MGKNIIVVAEILNNNLRSVTFELIAFAEKLAELNSANIKIIIINNAPVAHAEEISKSTGYDVIAVATPLLEHYNGEAYKSILQAIIGDLNPLFICVGHTSQGLDFAPGLSVRLGCSCITCINGIAEKDNKTIFSRYIFGGKINAFIQPETEVSVLTIQPSLFKKDNNPEKPGEIVHLTLNTPPLKMKNSGITKPESSPSHLSDAKTIIAIGRGIEDPENITLAEKFSHLFTNAALACSRPVVDMGWMRYKHQVGITGTEVAPDLYIACGISGSSQHIAGMNKSKFVVAINNDPNAAIFNVSDICIVDDILGFFQSFEENHALTP